MNIVNTFENFVNDFEKTAKDDNWSRLKAYLAPDATYQNIGTGEPAISGSTEILDYLKSDFSNVDRRFDSRIHAGIETPRIENSKVLRKWRCKYSLKGTPDLIVEGEARYTFENGLIKKIEEELSAESLNTFAAWMKEHGNKL